MRSDLERFFNPRAIAIIGASQDLNTISGQPLRFLKGHGYEGKLYPVNPRYEEVAGLRSLLLASGLPVDPPADMAPGVFLELMARDKKVVNGRLRLVTRAVKRRITG